MIQHNANVSTRIVCNEAEPCAKNVQVNYGEVLALDDLHDITFDDSGIDESLLTPWIMDTPMQHSLDGGLSSSSSGTPASAVDFTTSESSFSARSRSTTVAPPGQLSELSAADTPLIPLLSPSAAEGTNDLEFWKEPHTAHDDIAQVINADRHGAVGSPREALSLEPWGKRRTESNSCCCLLSSISFLESLVSKSTTRENRIDLLLADVRNSMETLAIFMACERCAARVEQNMLLALAARQISAICGKTANCYKAINLCGLGDTNSPRHKPELDASVGLVDISVSTYRVNRRERLHLLKSLVTLQIVECQQHINTIKSRYRNWPNHGQVEALIEAEKHIKSARLTISSHS
ncbi:MAG: hypothetical protein M1821_009200 [Bathelium mastoideum]|nr:MAG: hypothetical protein M1821_009200 [Bathelium mastoideum]